MLENKSVSFRNKKCNNTNEIKIVTTQNETNEFELTPDRNSGQDLKNCENFLRPTYNLEINGNANLSMEDSPKISSSSYTTTLSSNKMFYIPNDSCQFASKEDDSSKSSKIKTETPIKKSKSFSFERNFNERKSLENDKKRNLSYFSHHSCKLKFNLEMDFLKKFSITNENNK